MHILKPDLNNVAVIGLISAALCIGAGLVFGFIKTSEEQAWRSEHEFIRGWHATKKLEASRWKPCRLE